MTNKPKNAKLIDSDLGHFRVMNFININLSVLEVEKRGLAPAHIAPHSPTSLLFEIHSLLRL